ncbi:EAL domain-containing protein [Granulosicoccus antarcticus]|uniref:EAL domain-containing protein n=1 Tax=Granulosicoccus antarcticus TaxID=437505 RepID=UPI00197A9DB8|nr:EAL domain-containing protein [Granulosicoccus antarcticus]
MAHPSVRSEADRLESLRSLNVLDSEPEAEFDALVRIAAKICNAPISLISLVDETRHRFKANVGLPHITETPRSLAFCHYAIQQQGILEIGDCLLDKRVAANPLVTGEPGLRFYAGAPLCLSDGARVGSLCVLDKKPGMLTEDQREMLMHLARVASIALESRRAVKELMVSESRFRCLSIDSSQLLQQTSELAKVGGWELDLASNKLTWSEQTCRIHGLPADYEPQIDTAIEFFALKSREKIRLAIERLMHDGTPYDMELQLLRADGRCIWVRVLGDAVKVDGKTVRLRGVIQDIDEHTRQRVALQNAHERITLATDSGEIGIWEWGIRDNRLEWSPQVFRLHGIEPATESPGAEGWMELVHPDDKVRVMDTLLQTLDGTGNLVCDFRIVWKDGSVRHLRSTAHVKRNSVGRAVALLGVNFDVTDMRRLSSELAQQQELLQVTLQSIDEAVITVDTQGQIVWLNPAAESLTGWACHDALGKSQELIYKIVHEKTGLMQESSVSACLREGRRVSRKHDLVLRARGAREYGVEDSASPILDAQGQLLGVVLAVRDVSEQRRLSQLMTHRATVDELTQTFNRSEFEVRLSALIDEVQERPGEHALMFIDLDQFKLVNDTCGHPVGDLLLRQIAGILRQSIRHGDTLARLGGDEFGIILRSCDAQRAGRIAQEICDSMHRSRFSHDSHRFRIGASIGLVPLDDRWGSMAAIMQAADTSCYAAKEAGRNRVHIWFDTDHAMRARRGDAQWAERLEQSLDESRFELYAQRLVTMGSRVAGLNAEVLIRLRDDQGNIILPGAFLPAAERFHLATRVDRWVLQKAIEALVELPDLSGIELLWVNLSGQSVGDREFQRDAIQMLDRAGSDIRQRICLEITETAAVTNIADAAVFIEKLRTLNVRTALDDFGAGVSSFGYLKSLPVDTLKLDGQFISNIINDPLAAAAVRCFVDVAEVVGLTTVAEHVENAEVLARVQSLGVDYVQGFLLHEPEPIGQVLECATISSYASHG